jgi:hypothetical protein
MILNVDLFKYILSAFKKFTWKKEKEDNVRQTHSRISLQILKSKKQIGFGCLQVVWRLRWAFGRPLRLSTFAEPCPSWRTFRTSLRQSWLWQESGMIGRRCGLCRTMWQALFACAFPSAGKSRSPFFVTRLI